MYQLVSYALRTFTALFPITNPNRFKLPKYSDILMELHQIETYIDSPNPQNRMKAITELRNYEPNLVVPLLKRRMCDQEFIIRSFVATGLGFKRTDEAFELLLDLIEHDRDYNVRAEAANSLAKYGEGAIPHLVKLFQQDSNWLVRYSIFAAIDLTQHPETLLELSVLGLRGDDPVVRETALASLGQLAKTTARVLSFRATSLSS